jgi:hypothetical protein
LPISKFSKQFPFKPSYSPGYLPGQATSDSIDLRVGWREVRLFERVRWKFELDEAIRCRFSERWAVPPIV